MSASRSSRGRGASAAAPRHVPRPPENLSSHRSERDTPYSLAGIVADVCRRYGVDPAEAMRPLPSGEEEGAIAPPPAKSVVPEPPDGSPSPRRAPVDRSSAAAMARAVCAMDDDTFWIVYVALSVEFERRFGEGGLATRVMRLAGSRVAGEA